MNKTFRLWGALAFFAAAFAGLAAIQPALACGGFFCQNSPVDQNAERIIFAHNKDGTISTYVQIQYTGSAEDFSWILPLPAPIGPEDLEAPEDAMAAFTELEVATDPVFIPPPMPQCMTDMLRSLPMAVAAMPESMDVEVFATGEVGPYGFDVIGSEDPEALVTWLRSHDYMVTREMEPLIDLYVEESFVFLAMRLLPDQGAQNVQPIKITYPAERPMIPLRLTAVAANPDMAVMVWVYADRQAVPTNYAEVNIADTELIFTGFGGNNYRQLMGDRADEYGGQGFITEYAAPARELTVVHPLLKELGGRYPYVTRLNTVISPEEMTVDPVFDYDPQRKDVSNIHDLSSMTGVYDCERPNIGVVQTIPGNTGTSQGQGGGRGASTGTGNGSGSGTAGGPGSGSGQTNGTQSETPIINTTENPPAAAGNGSGAPAWALLTVGGAVGGGLVALLGGLVALGVFLGRRARA